jgi:glutamine cyclotransferase
MAMSGAWSNKIMRQLLIFALLFVVACSGSGKKGAATGIVANSESSNAPRYVSGLKITAPLRKAVINQSSDIKVEWESSYPQNIDSVQVVYDNRLVVTLSGSETTTNIQSQGKVGVRNIKLQAFYADGSTSVAVTPITVLPAKAERWSYRVKAAYPHSTTSFTQGLYYKDGFLYEGTGQYGTSALLKVEPQSGKILSQVDLKRNYFGEGITALNGKIYQLTWTNGVCLVYNESTMEQIAEYSYASQGWGLATFGDKLIMSDGSNMLTVLNPENFEQLYQVQVYDNNGPVEQLNELEYIDGYVWANVWQSDRVVVINPENGAVVADIDFSGLLTKEEQGRLDMLDHVLNGIAYNKDRGTYYITGKCWPKLFEIELKK